MSIPVRIALSLLFVFTCSMVLSQAKHEFSEAIEDNSFLVEEAYNQEAHVVQHIFNGLYLLTPNHDLLLSFTQEWPLFKVKQQLSYTLPYNFLTSPDNNGFGDVMINYRYQVFYKNDWACLSPRLSVILPTGNQAKGLGNGVFGVQINIPASKRLSDYWVVHLNAGSTFYPNVKQTDSLEVTHIQNLASFNLGGSAIWLCSSNFNVMLEVVENFTNEFNLAGKTLYNNILVINPGVRFAINIGKLQVVPGISMPVAFSNNQNIVNAFFYLSFEHPY